MSARPPGGGSGKKHPVKAGAAGNLPFEFAGRHSYFTRAMPQRAERRITPRAHAREASERRPRCFKRKPEPNPNPDPVGAFRYSLNDILFRAGHAGASLHALAKCLEDEAIDLRRRIILNEPFREGRCTTLNASKSKTGRSRRRDHRSSPRCAILSRTTQPDIAAFWDKMETRQRR